MQNVLVNMCENFHNDQLRNDGSIGIHQKSDYNNAKNTTLIALGDPLLSPKIVYVAVKTNG